MGTRQGVVVGIVAAALGVLVAQPLAGKAATLPQHTSTPALPQLTVPTASVPPVTVPSVSTPVGTTPSVTTPRVTTPARTTPSLSVPSVTTPPVSTPVATVPSVTTPPMGAPSGTAPARTTASKVSALVGGATRSAQASGAPGDPASAAPDTAAPAGGAAGALPAAALSSAGTPGTTGVAGVAGVAADAHSALARGRDGAPRHASARARRLAAARESRRLRRLVGRLHGCLGTLGVGARRLLTLRAGLHGPAHSAAAAARILRVSAGREARLERLALVALQRSAGTGCADPASVIARAFASAGTLSPSAPQLPGGTAASGPAASLSAAHAERPPQGGRTAGTLPAPRGGAVQRAEADSSSFPSVLVPALLAALLLALALLAFPETRRGLRPAGAAPSPIGPGTPSPTGPAAAATREQPAKTHPPAAPIADPATARRPRSAAPGTKAKRTGMDEAMAQIAADVFAEMARDTPGPASHPQPEGYRPHPHVEVERELVPGEPAPSARPAPRAQQWAHEHATQAALAGTVVLGWLARLMRRGRRRRRRPG